MATIEERLAALEKAQEPKEPYKPRHPHVPFDPMKNISMPPSAMADLVRAVPNPQAIANDHIGKPGLPSVPSERTAKPGSGWIEPRPLVSESFWDPNRKSDAT
jgi:hypothetical protein